MQKSINNRTIFCRDNIEILRGMDSDSVDLIYADPPFNKKRDFHAPIGTLSEGASFKDTWYEEDTKDEWIGLIADEHPPLHDFLEGITRVGDKSNKYYLVYMAIRLLELKRVLKPTGSIYLHCDPTMSHFLKLLMDCIFGSDNFRNEIVWHYTGRRMKSPNRLNSKHDIVLFYAKSEKFKIINYPFDTYTKDEYFKMKRQQLHRDEDGREWIWGHAGRGKSKHYKIYLDEVIQEGRAVDDVWDIPIINTSAKEKLGYPTQKPLALLERIIKASSKEGDLVLDPFCGCATTCVASEKLSRKWIGIDVSPKAFDLVKLRLNKEISDDGDLLKRVNSIVYRNDIPVRTDLVQTRPKRNELKQLLYGKQRGLCAGCAILFPFQNFTIDHILPKAKGGQDNPENLQLLCGHCNSIKNHHDMQYLKARLREMKFIN